MSFARPRIVSSLRRVLSKTSIRSAPTSKGKVADSRWATCPLGDCRFLTAPEFLQRRPWSYTESKLMASTVAEADLQAAVQEQANGNVHGLSSLGTAKVIFVLGGPGSGKGTQCALIVEHFGFTHLSAGDLLRAEINSGNENGVMIQNMIKEGKIVPSEVTVKLLQNAMLKSGNDKFLIDGFPRNEENRAAFELVTGIQPQFILFFDCPEEEMEKRLLARNQGRVDDNIETIRKRFKVFVESSLPVINHYDSIGKVRKVDAARTREEVFEMVKSLFQPFQSVEQVAVQF